MRKKVQEALCPSCEWSGDATGISHCPECGSQLTLIDDFDEEKLTKANVRYPSEVLGRLSETDDQLVE